MHVQWIANPSTSALHIAEAHYLFSDRLVDPGATESFVPFAQRLGSWIATHAPEDPDRFWDDLLGLSAGIASNHELASVVLRKRLGEADSQAHAATLSGCITDIEAAFAQAFPKYQEQAGLRMRPLQEQWLGFGSGLLAHLKRLTEKEMLVAECRVVGVQPVLGGYGRAHWDQNLVRMEAVLTNPLAELPEVVRLAWLLAQLQLDLPRYQDALGASMTRRIAPIAMLAPSLAAAEVLELGRCDEATAALAVEHWQIALPSGSDLHAEVVPSLMDWWETYLQTRPSWSTALVALAKMLRAI